MYYDGEINRLRSVIERNTVVTPSGCWEWQLSKRPFGYGQIAYKKANGKWSMTETHRVMYQAARGPIPDGLCVLHTCDNPPCVNPDHLWIGTRGDNNQDRREKGRGNEAARIAKTKETWRDPKLRAKQSAFLRRRWAKWDQERRQEAGASDSQKHCCVCKQWKPKADFVKCAARKDGYQPRCKTCQNAIRQEWRAKRKAEGLPYR